MRIVKISPGKNAKLWKDCLQNAHICLGFRPVGDLRRLGSTEEVQAVVNKTRYHGKAPGPAKKVAVQLWTFRNLKAGDKVIANKGNSVVLRVGTVTGPYRWDARHPYHHVVPVGWGASCPPRRIPTQAKWNNNTVADVSPGLLRSITGKIGKEASNRIEFGDTSSLEARIVDSPNHHQLDYIVRTTGQIKRAKKDEERLLIDYRNWLGRQHRKLGAARYGKLQCDGFEEQGRNLIEAKSSIRREHIRMAVGQLLDYASQIRKKFGKTGMAILLPKKPDTSSVDWLPELNISVVWREGGAFFDNANGRFSGKPKGSNIS